MAFKKILVVEDERAFLAMLGRMLSCLGADLLLVQTVDEALAALDGGVDLVVTDVNLGTRSGVEVARAAAARNPAPCVIAMSGYAEASDCVELGKAGVSAFLAKPFTAQELLEIVEGLEAPRHVELDAVARRVVGELPMPDAIMVVRRAMVFEALARTQGNKAKAAVLLGVSRQNLQNILARGNV